MTKPKRISKIVIKRLPLYNRVLQQLEENKAEVVSSAQLAEKLGRTPAQIRKDLTYFGQFGRRGVGYKVSELREKLREILGIHRRIKVAIVGAGRLGQALMAYPGFRKQGFNIVAAFDIDPQKIGRVINQVKIYPLVELERFMRRGGIDIVILATPAPVAQEIVDRLLKLGIKAILNFVPARLVVPENVIVHYVDLAIELESLCYYTK